MADGSSSFEKTVADAALVKTLIADHQARAMDGSGTWRWSERSVREWCSLKGWSKGVRPMTKHFPKPPFKAQPQPIPGRSDKMDSAARLWRSDLPRFE